MGILMIADEIQSGLGRTGKTFACQWEGVQPDAFILGKALGGGIMPVSAVVSRDDVMDVFTPGVHGSTFGGNPLACALGREVINILNTDEHQAHAVRMGEYLRARIPTRSPVKEVRGRGLWIGIELEVKARPYCEALMQAGLLCKETHEKVIRLAPPLVITQEECDWALERLNKVL
jgi:ornithine--oxo-acid transaminase